MLVSRWSGSAWQNLGGAIDTQPGVTPGALIRGPTPYLALSDAGSRARVVRFRDGAWAPVGGPANGASTFANDVRLADAATGLTLAWREVEEDGDQRSNRIRVARFVPDPLRFSSATYSVAEGGGTATITVTRGGDGTGPASVGYGTTDGTAVAGADFAATSGTLTFADGDTTETFTVPITDDGLVEGPETFTARSSTPPTPCSARRRPRR